MGFFKCLESESSRLKRQMKGTILPAVFNEVENHLNDRDAKLAKDLLDRVTGTLSRSDEQSVKQNDQPVKQKQGGKQLMIQPDVTAQPVHDVDAVVNNLLPLLQQVGNNLKNQKQQQLLQELVGQLQSNVLSVNK